MTHCTKRARNIAPEFSALFWDRSLKCSGVYDETALEEIFIECMLTSTRPLMTAFPSINKRETLGHLDILPKPFTFYRDGLQ